MKRYRCAKWSEGWIPVEVVAHYNGWQIEIAHNPDSCRPYCVQYGGGGHYFNTMHETRAYCYGRGWLAHDGLIYKEERDAV